MATKRKRKRKVKQSNLWQRRQVERGRCPACGKDSIEGQRYCEPHQAKNRARAAARRPTPAKAYTCNECGEVGHNRRTCMRPGGGRAKGHTFEREVAERFREVAFDDARRGLQYRDGSDAADVVGVGRFWPECKIGRRTYPVKALQQAVDASTKARGEVAWIPLAICRNDRERATVTLRLDDFLVLLEEKRAVEKALALLAPDPVQP